MNHVVTRFAPSPTGYLHIGGIRTALINYIFTKQAKIKFPNSKFLLRIEDTDKIRSKNEFTKNILTALQWLNIKWDGKIIIQSERFEKHKKVAYDLLKRNLAFKCICTLKQLEDKRLKNKKNHLNVKRLCTNCEKKSEIQKSVKDYCIRIKIPLEGKISLTDKIQGKITVENKELDNFILLRKDSTPTYMLSAVVDDHDMGVNTIIRGDDHLNNTFRQFYIYSHLGWEIPQYAHLPLIHGMDGTKLSKRHGAININELKNIGYLPQSIINNLILLGWSPKKENEIIEFNEIVNIFNVNDLSKSSSIFDYTKLNYFNNYYLKKEENFIYFENFIENNKKIRSLYHKNKKKIVQIFNTHKQSIKFYDQLTKIIDIYFDDSFETKKNDILNNNFNYILKEFMIDLDNLNDWNQLNLELCIKKFIKNNKIKFTIFGQPLRIILTNMKNGPAISLILDILGKKNTFLRLNNYINRTF